MKYHNWECEGSLAWWLVRSERLGVREHKRLLEILYSKVNNIIFVKIPHWLGWERNILYNDVKIFPMKKVYEWIETIFEREQDDKMTKKYLKELKVTTYPNNVHMVNDSIIRTSKLSVFCRTRTKYVEKARIVCGVRPVFTF